MGRVNFWKNKKVLVTGFEGFIGSNLTRSLVDSGALVFGLDIVTKRKGTVLEGRYRSKISATKGSVTDITLVEKILKKNGIDTVFHLAAEAIVSKGLENPAKSFSTNVEGTWKVLDSCRKTRSVRAIVIASSDKAYGSHENLPYKETTPLNGKNPYDASKSCADIVAGSYCHAYGVPGAITRCGNVYGPGDLNFSRLIPEAIRCALIGKKFTIRSDGKFLRDYVYIDDIVSGYKLIAEKMKSLDLRGEAFNLSDGRPYKVLDIVKMILSITGARSGYKILDKAEYEIKNQYLDPAKARRVLGWSTGSGIEEGLQRTIDWYRGFFQKRGTNGKYL